MDGTTMEPDHGPSDRIEVTMECRSCRRVFVIIHPTVYDLERTTCSRCREEADEREGGRS